MNPLSTIIRISGLIFLLFLLACQTDLIENNQLATRPTTSQYEVVNGIMHFPDYKAFVNQLRLLSTQSLAEQVQFGRDESLISFLSSYQRELDKYDQLDSLSQQKVQLTYVSKYMTFTNGFPSLKIFSSSLAAIINEDGLIYIGKTVIRFVDDKEIVVKNGDVSKAMNLVATADSNVFIISTDNLSALRATSADVHARLATGSCPRLYGQQGDFSFYGDGSRVETTAHRMTIPLGTNDQYKVMFTVTTQGTYDNRCAFDGDSQNNSLSDVYTCDVYDFNNNVSGTRSVENYSHTYGHSIVHQEVIEGGQCYSFQTRYYYANFRRGTINPLGPGYSCNTVNCQYTYPIFVTDKHNVTTDCTN